MKRLFIAGCCLSIFSLWGINDLKAQSVKDLFSKKNIGKVIDNVIQGSHEAPNIIGTWTYKEPAVEFQSDDLLLKAGGPIASKTVEKKLATQLKKVGIAPGTMTFVFNQDNSFTVSVGNKPFKGSYTYDKQNRKLSLKFLGLIGFPATVGGSQKACSLLFEADTLLKVMAFLGSQSDDFAISTFSSLAKKYDGMQVGFGLVQ